jgi:hypothetical protein
VLRLRLSALALAFAGCLVFATAASAQGDSVVGSGEVDLQPFTIDAHSGPAGESPTGSLSFQLNVGTLIGNVTCLFVEGNEAVIGGEVLPGSDVATPGSGYLLHVRDVTGGIDLMRLELVLVPPTSCDFFNLVSPAAVTSGDIVITDAPAPPPLPTTKAECKNGGWRTFGVFKSQGDCLSFVAAERTDPPGL